MSRARKPVHIEPKGWGREVWIANNDKYCGKILEIRKGKRCSLHHHKLKTENFFLRAGRLMVRVKESPHSEVIQEFVLVAGECPDRPGASDGSARRLRAVRVLDPAFRYRFASAR